MEKLSVVAGTPFNECESEHNFSKRERLRESRYSLLNKFQWSI